MSFKSLFMFDEIDSGNAKSAGGGTVPPKNLVSLLKESKIKVSSKFLTLISKAVIGRTNCFDRIV